MAIMDSYTKNNKTNKNDLIGNIETGTNVYANITTDTSNQTNTYTHNMSLPKNLNPYYLYPFRHYIDANIAQLIKLTVQDRINEFKRITVFHDFDPSLIGFYTTESDIQWLLEHLAYTKDIVIHVIEYTVQKLIEQYQILKQEFKDKDIKIVLFSSVGQSKWHKAIYREYKSHRRIAKSEQLLSQVNMTLSDLQDYVRKTFISISSPIQITELSDFVKALKTLIKDYVSVAVNMYLKNQVFINVINLEADLVPYLILRQKYRTDSLYVILTNDKDLAQITGLSDPNIDNILLIRKVHKKQNRQNNQVNIDTAKSDTIDFAIEGTVNNKKTDSYIYIYTRKNAFAMLFGSEYTDMLDTLLSKHIIDKELKNQIGKDIYVNPYFVPLYLSITGDMSDNIPSCKTGLGKKHLFNIAWLIHIANPELSTETDSLAYLYKLYLTVVKLSDYTLVDTDTNNRIRKLSKQLVRYIASDKIAKLKQLLETAIKSVFGSSIQTDKEGTNTTEDNIRSTIKGILSNDYEALEQVLRSIEACTETYRKLKQLHVTTTQTSLCFIRNLYLTTFELYYQTCPKNQITDLLNQVKKGLQQDHTKTQVAFDTFMQYRFGLRTNIDTLIQNQ